MSMRKRCAVLFSFLALISVSKLAFAAPPQACGIFSITTSDGTVEQINLPSFVQTWRNEDNAAAETKIKSYREKLAVIETQMPRGFNTWSIQRRDRRMLTILTLLNLGQERKAKHLIRQLITDFRSTYQEFEDLKLKLAGTIRQFERSPESEQHHTINDIRTLEGRRVELLQKLGEGMLDYMGIAKILFVQAGLMPKPTLVADRFDYTVIADSAEQLAEDIKREMPELLIEEPTPIAGIGRRILAEFGMWDASTNKELFPSLAEIDDLYNTTPIMRAAKLEKEFKYERREARIEAVLMLANDQNLKRFVLEVLKRVTGGTMNVAITSAIATAEATANERLNEARVQEFINLSWRIPDTDEGNNQLAVVLTQILSIGQGSNGLMRAIALRQDAIEALNRVKKSAFAKETIWAENSGTLRDFIIAEEGARAETGTVTPVFNGETQRSFRSITTMALGLTGWLVYNYGDVGWSFISNLLGN